MSHWQRLEIKMTAMGTKQLARNSEMSISFGSLSAAELGDLRVCFPAIELSRIVAEGRLLHGVEVNARLNAKLAGLFRFSGVFGISVTDNRRELLDLIIWKYSFYASYTCATVYLIIR
jgi:hypothetical protein